MKRCLISLVDVHLSSQRPRQRPMVHATSNAKTSKHRLSLAEALRQDRARTERRRGMPWRQRLRSIRVDRLKFFLSFMLLWTWLGLYAVPMLKQGDDVSMKRLLGQST